VHRDVTGGKLGAGQGGLAIRSEGVRAHGRSLEHRSGLVGIGDREAEGHGGGSGQLAYGRTGGIAQRIRRDLGAQSDDGDAAGGAGDRSQAHHLILPAGHRKG